MTRLNDIQKGSDAAYEEAVKIVFDQIEFELETCRRFLGTDPKELLERLAKTELRSAHCCPN